MRKRYRVLLLAAVVVPVGFALSLEGSNSAESASPPVAAVAEAAVQPPRIVVSTRIVRAAWHDAPISEEAQLVLVGATLSGLAAAVRKAAAWLSARPRVRIVRHRPPRPPKRASPYNG